MSRYNGPALLTADHLVNGFDCGEAALNSWLRTRALANQRAGSSRTWVVVEDDQPALVVAFYASSTAAIARSEATSRARRNQPDPVPAMLLGRLAVDVRHRRKGLAAALLKHFLLKASEVAELTGVRLVLVHAKSPDAAKFYRRYDFEPSPIDPMTLMLLVEDINAAMPRPS